MHGTMNLKCSLDSNRSHRTGPSESYCPFCRNLTRSLPYVVVSGVISFLCRIRCLISFLEVLNQIIMFALKVSEDTVLIEVAGCKSNDLRSVRREDIY
jgi:hypothetical protein